MFLAKLCFPKDDLLNAFDTNTLPTILIMLLEKMIFSNIFNKVRELETVHNTVISKHVVYTNLTIFIFNISVISKENF